MCWFKRFLFTDHAAKNSWKKSCLTLCRFIQREPEVQFVWMVLLHLLQLFPQKDVFLCLKRNKRYCKKKIPHTRSIFTIIILMMMMMTMMTWLANMSEHFVLSPGSAEILRINCSIGVIPDGEEGESQWVVLKKIDSTVSWLCPLCPSTYMSYKVKWVEYTNCTCKLLFNLMTIMLHIMCIVAFLRKKW